VNPLFASRRTEKFKFPSSVGIVPIRSFPSRVKYVRLVLARVAGRVPENLQFSKPRNRSLVHNPISFGRVPFIPVLPDRCNSTMFVNL